MTIQIFAWRTIKLGTFSDVKSLIQTTTDAGFKIGDWAKDVLNSEMFALSSVERDVNLVKITPKELGFADGAHRIDIYKKAQELGLELCPLEVGPQLRLQYVDQPYLESLQIGMEPQKDLEGHESEFRVVNGVDHCLWLVGDHKHPDDFWGPNEPFIFVKP
jgi:hypothetical protein